MNLPVSLIAGVTALSSLAVAQDVPLGPNAFDARTTRYVGVYDVATGVLTPPGAATRGAPGLGDPIYNNSAPTGSFFNSVDGRLILDEGRIPTPSSTNVMGTQESYGLSSIQVGYATNATDPSLGGMGISLQITLYENYSTCGNPSSSEAALVTIDISGLPGSTSGGIGGFVFDVDLSSLAICIRGDGGNGYSNGADDLFGWSVQVTDAADASAAGPLLSGDPNNFPFGDSTVFQNPGATSGTGLDTVDAFGQVDPDGTPHCFFFGGYPANVFSSYHLIVRSELLGDCIGCGIGDDRFEPNDTFATAAPIDLGTYNRLISDAADVYDYYSLTIPADSEVVVDLLFINAISDLDLIIYDSMNVTIDSSGSVTDNERVIFSNCSGAAADVVVRVQNWSLVCNDYDLALVLNPLFADDALEDNDECATAVPLPLGSTLGLVVRPCGGTTGGDDGDYYSTVLPDGDSITVDILFVDDDADIDLILYDTTGGCNGVTLDTSFSTSDNEHVAYTNTTGSAMDIVVRVDHWSGASGRYEMRAKIGAATIGELVCIGVNNSTGSPGQLCAIGSDVAADNDLTLEVTSLPVNALGYFIVSMDTILVQNPGGSVGNLCIASFSIGRYSNDVLDSGAAGAVSFGVDLTMIPIASSGGTGTVAAMAGDTFYWQHWTRDMDTSGAAVSNFSDAVGVTFQ